MIKKTSLILLFFINAIFLGENADILKKITGSLAALAISALAYNKSTDIKDKQLAVENAICSIQTITNNIIDICTKETDQVHQNEMFLSRYDYLKERINLEKKRGIFNPQNNHILYYFYIFKKLFSDKKN